MNLFHNPEVETNTLMSNPDLPLTSRKGTTPPFNNKETSLAREKRMLLQGSVILLLKSKVYTSKDSLYSISDTID
jgi:hypothetical protein